MAKIRIRVRIEVMAPNPLQHGHTVKNFTRRTLPPDHVGPSCLSCTGAPESLGLEPDLPLEQRGLESPAVLLASRSHRALLTQG